MSDVMIKTPRTRPSTEDGRRQHHCLCSQWMRRDETPALIARLCDGTRIAAALRPQLLSPARRRVAAALPAPEPPSHNCGTDRRQTNRQATYTATKRSLRRASAPAQAGPRCAHRPASQRAAPTRHSHQRSAHPQPTSPRRRYSSTKTQETEHPPQQHRIRHAAVCVGNRPGDGEVAAARKRDAAQSRLRRRTSLTVIPRG